MIDTDLLRLARAIAKHPGAVSTRVHDAAVRISSACERPGDLELLASVAPLLRVGQ